MWLDLCLPFRQNFIGDEGLQAAVAKLLYSPWIRDQRQITERAWDVAAFKYLCGDGPRVDRQTSYSVTCCCDWPVWESRDDLPQISLSAFAAQGVRVDPTG